jgi:hypothetical protein
MSNGGKKQKNKSQAAKEWNQKMTGKPPVDDRSIDDLMAFIDGPKKTPSKKPQEKKKKKPQVVKCPDPVRLKKNETLAAMKHLVTAEGPLSFRLKVDKSEDKHGETKPLPPGRHRLTILAQAKGDFLAGETSVMLCVKDEQTIKWSDPPPIRYGQTLKAVKFNATASGGKSPSYKIDGTPIDQIDLLEVGEHTIEVNAPETDNHHPKTATWKLQVQKAVPSVTWKPPAVWHGGKVSDEHLKPEYVTGDGEFEFVADKETIVDVSAPPTLSVTAKATDRYEALPKVEVTLTVVDQEDVAEAFGIKGTDLSSLAKDLGGEQNLLTLMSDFQPEELAGLARELGGAPQIAAILPTIPSSQLKQACDGFGGPLGFAAAYNDGLEKSPEKLEELIDAFDGNLSSLGELTNEGGLGAHPKVLGHLIGSICEGDYDQLKQLCGAFKKKESREQLKGVLTEGGLATRPEILSSLLKRGCEGEPKGLVAFCDEFKTPEDQKKLKELVDHGLGGLPTEVERLGDVLGRGLGGEPKRLKELHTAFNGGPPPGADLRKLKKTLDSLNSPSPPPPPPPLPERTGSRLRNVLTLLNRPPGDPKKPDVSKLKTSYYNNLESSSSAGNAQSVRDRAYRDESLVKTFATAKEHADSKGATKECKAAVASAKKLMTASSVLSLAEPELPVEYSQALTTALNTASECAELSNMSAATGLENRNRIVKSLGETGLEGRELDERVNVEAEKLNQAARDAAEIAKAAAVEANKVGATKETIQAAALAAEAAFKAARAAVSDSVIQATLTDAIAAMEAVAAATRTAAKTQANTQANSKSQASALAVGGAGTPQQKEAAITAAARSRLQAVLANSNDASEKLLNARVAESKAREVAANSASTDKEISDALNTARLADQAARDALATAARDACLDAYNKLPIDPDIPTADQLAELLAFADAAISAAVEAHTTGIRNATFTAADNAYKLIRDLGTPGNSVSNLETAAPFGVEGSEQLRALAGVAKQNLRKGESPLSLESLLRIGSTMKKKNLPDDFAINSKTNADMAHICGRHTRECFTFAEDELCNLEDVFKGFEIAAKKSGQILTQNESSLVAKTDESVVKPTTLFPETVDPAKIREYLKKAVSLVESGSEFISTGNGKVPFSDSIANSVSGGGFLQAREVPVGDGFTVTIGFRRGSHGSVKVVQMYPDGGPGLEKVDFFDMHAIKKGLSL